ncbi:hypothetical protein OROGR_031602 [Orobanche gracilis]
MGERGRGCCPPMDLMRSEPMQLVQLIIPIESAHLAVSYLGDLGLIQFKDLNAEKSPFQRTYAIQIKRCGEMARKLRFFRDQMSKEGMLSAARPVTQAVASLDDLEFKLGDLEAELVEINANAEKLQRSYNELAEYRLVLKKFTIKIDRESEMITFDGKVVHGSTFFRYLGSIIQKDGDLDGDVAHRIKAGWLKWKSATGVLCDPDMPHRLKGKFYRTPIRPALLYGTECWAVKQCHVQKMNVAEMRMLRWMCGHTKKDRLRNEVIREKTC